MSRATWVFRQCISRRYFSRSRACRFTATTCNGGWPWALNLLGDRTDLTGLALDLGFPSYSHFSSAFKRAYYQTPREFQARRPGPLSRAVLARVAKDPGRAALWIALSSLRSKRLISGIEHVTKHRDRLGPHQLCRGGLRSGALFVHGVLLNKHLWRHQLAGLVRHSPLHRASICWPMAIRRSRRTRTSR